MKITEKHGLLLRRLSVRLTSVCVCVCVCVFVFLYVSVCACVQTIVCLFKRCWISLDQLLEFNQCFVRHLWALLHVYMLVQGRAMRHSGTFRVSHADRCFNRANRARRHHDLLISYWIKGTSVQGLLRWTLASDTLVCGRIGD